MNMKHPAVVAFGAFLAVWGTTSNFALKKPTPLA